MKESSTYQAILEEGESQGVLIGERKALLLVGTRRFGPPEAQIQAAIERIDSITKLEQMTDQLLDATDWDELLASA